MSRKLIYAALYALVLAWIVPFPCVRLARNAWRANSIPRQVEAKGPACDALHKDVTIVMAVKDMCSNADITLAHLASIIGRRVPIVYVTPNYPDCVDAVPREVLGSLFLHSTIVTTDVDTSPIGNFKAAYPHVGTPYVMLMHNDVYPMDNQSVCELQRALERHPEAGIAAPQLYERASDDIVVPHGHHRNLRIRNGEVAYDLDADLITRREPVDFHEYAQLSFVEDHAFMARTHSYRSYMDEHASFTMEYVDIALNLLQHGTFAWYTPSSRFIFDVDTGRLGWRDVGYLMRKRSDEVGMQVWAYMQRKWSVTFPVTNIWRYVRDSMLEDMTLTGDDIPRDHGAQLRLVAAWFQGVGYNRFNEAQTTHGGLTTTTSLEQASRIAASYDIHPTVSYDAKALLSVHEERAGVRIAVQDDSEPGVRVTADCNARNCDLLYATDNGACKCFVRERTYERRFAWMEAILRVCRLPSRVWRFVQMKLFSSASHDPPQKNLNIGFGERARLLKWKW